jgi:hypothetical protein
MAGTGIATLDFGAGSNEAQVTVLVPLITATSKAESWVMGDDTSTDHTASDHRYFPVFASLTCGTPVDSTGFTIYARSIHKLTGTWTVRYVWAE